MRNLKKILAMALALVMSLSLMATAGAAETTAVSGTSQYQTATKVLKGVKVIWGDEGGDRLQDTITRAEVAALLYRISTGDVTDSQKDLYTNNAFTDVNGIKWARGYISYCYNAEIIKGNPDGTFEPDENITGYATLAMILRAMGYGKNGEFVGDGWEIQTAATGERIGVLKNINQAQLGQPATREMVAEILFRAILKETVEFSALNPYAYPTTGKTLAKEKLGLEEVEGVITANEYADLYDVEPLAEGKTRLGAYTIEATTGFDDIGESRLAYIQNGTKVIAISDSGKNAVAETTDAKKATALMNEANIEADSETERFVNFGQGTYWTSDWKIKYVVTLGGGFTLSRGINSASALSKAEEDAWSIEIQRILYEYAADGYNFNLPTDPASYTIRNYSSNDAKTEYYHELTYTVEFRINEKIAPQHQQNIEEIFNVADKRSEYTYITGEVYVGTTSMKDISDEKSFEQFKTDYIEETDEAVVSENDRGNWLKVIDNDGDGKTDYVLKVIYTMAQVTGVKDDKITLDVKNRTLADTTKTNEVCAKDPINTLTSQPVTTKDDADYDDPAPGDVVYYAIIDGSAFAYLADTEVASFENVNRNTRVATTTDGTEWTESQVCEHIVDEAYMSNITAIAGKVSYDVYFDRGGYIAAFAKTEVSNLQLITDGWFNSTKNDGYEYAVKVYDSENDEQTVVDLDKSGSLFISGLVENNGTKVQNNDWGALKYLGGTIESNGANNNIKTVSSVDYPAALNGATLTGSNPSSKNNVNVVKTTVAAIADGTILPVESASVSGRYSRNMIDMNGSSVATRDHIPNKNYKTGTIYTTSGNSNTAYDAADAAVEVRALTTTVYYVVYPTGNGNVGVKTFVGYDKIPSTVTNAMIEDVYAVGTRHAADNKLGNDTVYYTADVVVIELNQTYPGSREIVFLLDDEVSMGNVSKRPVRVIDKDGAEKTVTVVNQPTLGNGARPSTENYNYATPKFFPGLYWLDTTSVKDEYTLDEMSGKDIIDAGFIVGMVQYEKVPSDNKWVSLVNVKRDATVNDFIPDTTDTGTGYEVNPDTLWKLGYGVEKETKYWENAAEAGTYPASEALVGQRDVVYTLAFGQTRDSWQIDHDAVKAWYNYNRVLALTKDGKMTYAISFDNLTSETGKTPDFAREVWEYIADKIDNADLTVGKNEITFTGTVTGSGTVTSDKFKIYDGSHNLLASDGKVYTSTKDNNRYIVKAPAGYIFAGTGHVASNGGITYALSGDSKELTVVVSGVRVDDSSIGTAITVALTQQTENFTAKVFDENGKEVTSITVDDTLSTSTPFNNTAMTLDGIAADQSVEIIKVIYDGVELKKTDYVVNGNVITLNSSDSTKKIEGNFEIVVRVVAKTYTVVLAPEGLVGTKSVDNSKTISGIILNDYTAVEHEGSDTDKSKASYTENSGVYTFTVNAGYDLEVTVRVNGADKGYAYGDVVDPENTQNNTELKIKVTYVEGVSEQDITVANNDKYKDALNSGNCIPTFGDKALDSVGEETVEDALIEENIQTITATTKIPDEADNYTVENITAECSGVPAGVAVYKVVAENKEIRYYAVNVTVSAAAGLPSADEALGSGTAVTDEGKAEIPDAVTSGEFVTEEGAVSESDKVTVVDAETHTVKAQTLDTQGKVEFTETTANGEILAVKGTDDVYVDVERVSSNTRSLGDGDVMWKVTITLKSNATLEANLQITVAAVTVEKFEVDIKPARVWDVKEGSPDQGKKAENALYTSYDVSCTENASDTGIDYNIAIKAEGVVKHNNSNNTPAWWVGFAAIPVKGGTVSSAKMAVAETLEGLGEATDEPFQNLMYEKEDGTGGQAKLIAQYFGCTGNGTSSSFTKDYYVKIVWTIGEAQEEEGTANTVTQIYKVSLDVTKILPTVETGNT